MKEIKGKYNTAFVYADTVEDSCLKQMEELCNQEWAKDSKIRFMADCHSGRGCVIGTTMTFKDKIVPYLVGVDGSCGMLTVTLGDVELDLAQLDKIIKRNIPLGMNVRSASDIKINFEEEWNKLQCKEQIDHRQVSRSIGSLGGGNHFIEIDIDDNGCKYLVIHTGSRNFGKRVADYYQKMAVDYQKAKASFPLQHIIQTLKANGKTHLIQAEIEKHKVNITDDLCYLEGDLFDRYLNDMNIVQKMAVANRKAIADVICRCMHIKMIDQFETIHNYIDIAHNILRKGAVSALNGEKCLIPINMHDGSLICIGKGNPDYNYSAPHGAGRLMSRTEAKKTLSMTEFKDTMKDIYSSTVCEDTLDEAPNAYKPIAEIMANIVDTVDIIKHIKPVYNIKATVE
jgi:tRNA-splicing ligase RtcB